MEIQCPSCQKKLAIGDQFAGQLIKCPACNGVFMAPSLSPMVSAPPIATPAPSAPLASPPLASPPMLAPTVMERGLGTPPVPSAPTVSNPAGTVSNPAPFASPVGSSGTVPGTSPGSATVPATSPGIIPFDAEPPSPPPMPSYAPPPPPPPPPSKPRFNVDEIPPGPPGEFTKSHTCSLRPDILRWVTPILLGLIFVLSFFAWIAGKNLWQIAFGEPVSTTYVLYILLTFFVALPLSVAKLLLEKNIIPMLDPLRPFWAWRSVLVGGILLLTIIMPVVHLMEYNLTAINYAAHIAMSIAIRFHLLAIVACGLEYWLEVRKRSRLPLPEFTARW